MKFYFISLCQDSTNLKNSAFPQNQRFIKWGIAKQVYLNIFITGVDELRADDDTKFTKFTYTKF